MKQSLLAWIGVLLLATPVAHSQTAGVPQCAEGKIVSTAVSLIRRVGE